MEMGTAEGVKVVQRIVDQVSNGEIPEFIAVNTAARYGYVLHTDFPIAAYHVSNKQCGSCKHWEMLGFHMGIVDGRCKFDDEDFAQDTDSCFDWEPAIMTPPQKRGIIGEK